MWFSYLQDLGGASRGIFGGGQSRGRGQLKKTPCTIVEKTYPEPWNYSSFYQFHAQKAVFEDLVAESSPYEKHKKNTK